MVRRRRFETLPQEGETAMAQFAPKTRKKVYVKSTKKGGSVKTTKTLCDSNIAKKSGKRVCAIDMDHAQGNLTFAFGYNQMTLKHSVFTLMIGESTIEETVLPTYYDPKSGIFFDPTSAKKMEQLGLASLDEAVRGPDLIPMNPIHCEGTEQTLVHQRGDWGLLLRDLISRLDYDEFHVDTNPDTNSIYPKIAVYAATDVEIPSTLESWAIQGWIMFARFLVQARVMNPTYMIAGVSFSRLRYAAHREALDMAKDEIMPAVNDLFTEVHTSYLKAGRPEQAKKVEGLHLEAFETLISEHKNYSIHTNRRATVVTAPRKNKGDFTPLLEQWQAYIELLKKTNGAGVPQVVDQYNLLIEEYEQARD